jgi:hypothetical protein
LWFVPSRLRSFLADEHLCGRVVWTGLGWPRACVGYHPQPTRQEGSAAWGFWGTKATRWC